MVWTRKKEGNTDSEIVLRYNVALEEVEEDGVAKWSQLDFQSILVNFDSNNYYDLPMSSKARLIFESFCCS